MSLKYYETPANLPQELEEYKGWVEDYRQGKISHPELKPRRVPFGVYEQREDGTYMVRIRAAAGGVTPAQLRRAAHLARDYGSGEVHITTRMEMQVHRVSLEDTVTVLHELYKDGLTSRGGGGNTVRNIMAAWNAGIDPEELFDVAPHACALTTRLITEPDSWNLPRKFKITFSGSSKDEGLCTINDLGFMARERDGKRGFQVYTAGGLGGKPSVSIELFDFIDESEVYNVTRAMKIFFDEKGNRKNKHAARLRHLRYKLGDEEFIRQFKSYYEKVKGENHPVLELKDLPGPKASLDFEPEKAEGKDFELWKERYVINQKQENYVLVLLPAVLGDVPWEQAVALADLLENFGEGTLRYTTRQNVAIRHIPLSHLANLYNGLKKIGLLPDFPKIIGESVACTGAATCRLGICLSRGLLTEVNKALVEEDMDLDKVADIKINVSGCPNSCGQHWIGDINFFGKAARNGSNAFPAYQALLGGHLEQGASRLASTAGGVNIAAKDVPRYVAKVLRHYLENRREGQTFNQYLEEGGREQAKSLEEEFRTIPSFEESPAHYRDWGKEEKFSTIGMGQGECSAGLFDLIDLDLKNSKKAADRYGESGEGKDLYQQLLSSTRALLVTKGLEPKSVADIFDFFQDHFIEKGICHKKYRDLMSLGRLMAGAMSLDGSYAELVKEFSQGIRDLYDSMDDSLRFPDEKKEEPKAETKEKGQAGRKEDFRGVPCPMNYVKTKLILETMSSGETIEVLLDDGEPIKNVPRSVDADGYKILAQTRIEEYWSLVIQK